MYLFVKNKDDFSDVPDSLLMAFGKPSLVMVLNLNQRQQLAYANIDKVKESLRTLGYYLQMPPTQTDALQQIRNNNSKL